MADNKDAPKLAKQIIELANGSHGDQAAFVATALVKAKAMSFDTPVESYHRSQPFAMELLSSACVSLESISELANASGAKRFWSMTDSNGNGLAKLMAERLSAGNAADRLILDEAVKRETPESAKKITVENRGGYREPLIVALLNNPEKFGTGAINDLLSRGLDLASTSFSKDDGPVAKNIKSPDTWNAFVSLGGNPGISVPLNGSKAPLWLAVRERCSVSSEEAARETKKLAEEWASKNNPDIISKKIDSEYWENIRKTWSDAGKSMRARSDWHLAKDPFGRSAMMTLVDRKADNIKEFWEVKKALPGCAQTDMRGRSLWFYLLGTAKEWKPGTSKWLINNVPVSKDHSGRGVFVQLSNRFAEDSEQPAWRLSLPSLTVSHAIISSHPNALDWFAGDEESVKRVCKEISPLPGAGSKRFNGAMEFLAVASRITDVSSLDPLILGLMAVNEIVALSSGSRMTDDAKKIGFQMEDASSVVARLLSLGAVSDVSDETEAEILSIMPSSDRSFASDTLQALRSEFNRRYLDSSVAKPKALNAKTARNGCSV